MHYISKQKYQLLEKENSKEYSGVPGLYAAFPKQGYNSTPLYIGFTMDLYRRCMLDHQKPSQDLARRMVHHKVGSNESDFDCYHTYFRIAKIFLDEVEFRVIKTYSKDMGKYSYLKDQAKAQESVLLEVFTPIYNKRHG